MVTLTDLIIMQIKLNKYRELFSTNYRVIRNLNKLQVRIDNIHKTLKRHQIQIDTCAICLDETNEFKTNCGHIFHINCITAVIQQQTPAKCPLCRRIL